MGSQAVQGYPGSEVVILNNKFHIAGALEPTGTSLDYAILMHVASARRLAWKVPILRKIYWDRIGRPDDLISAVLVKTDETHSREEIARAIRFLGNVKVINTLMHCLA